MSSYSVVSTMRAPTAGWARTQVHSSSVSGPGLRSSRPAAPRGRRRGGCRRAARAPRTPGPGPSSRAVSSAKRPTRWQWDVLPVSRTSSASARFSSAASSTCVSPSAARRAREDAGHLGARDHRAVAAEPLGGVERLVGGAQQAVGGLAVQREGRDPEADRELGLVLLLRQRLEHRRADRARRACTRRARRVGREQSELLAADPCRAVEAALGAVDRVGHALEDRVAGGVAVCVVDPLEAVEVADDQAERLVGAAGALELDVEHVLEAAPVEQVGERVAVGGLAEALDQAARAGRGRATTNRPVTSSVTPWRSSRRAGSRPGPPARARARTPAAIRARCTSAAPRVKK